MSGPPIAFVLSGGGILGAVEVGMLRALLEYGVRPDLIVGTSIGAINGAVVATDPTPQVVGRLAELWSSRQARQLFGDWPHRQLGRIARRAHLHSPEPLRDLLVREMGGPLRFNQLAVRFECCAASIERAAEHWFHEGDVVSAVLASAAVPGLLPPIFIDGEHYIDGGIVNSIPVGRAVELGAGTVYVLQVGRIDRPLKAPRHVLEVARVAFEVSRRHRFAREMAAIPATVDVHVLPTGRDPGAETDSPLAYRDLAAAADRIGRAYDASIRFLRQEAR